MAGVLEKILVGFTFIILVNSQGNIRVPSTELIFNTQRSSTLPIAIQCPFPNYKFIEIRGVTFVNETTVIVASTRFPNIERAANEECLASLSETADRLARCSVSMKDFVFDDATKKMEKAVTFDCRKTAAGDSASEIKTVSKKKGTMNIRCSNKDARPEILDISLASGKSVNVVEAAWKCNEENIANMAKGQSGGHCQIKRNGELNKSEMMVKYKCSNPPRRDFDEFVQGKKGKKKQ